jgi:hypothetical protein
MEAAKAFVNFFKSLPRHEREAVLAWLVADDQTSEDLTDTLISEFHRQESRHAADRKTVQAEAERSN